MTTVLRYVCISVCTVCTVLVSKLLLVAAPQSVTPQQFRNLMADHKYRRSIRLVYRAETGALRPTVVMSTRLIDHLNWNTKGYISSCGKLRVCLWRFRSREKEGILSAQLSRHVWDHQVYGLQRTTAHDYKQKSCALCWWFRVREVVILEECTSSTASTPEVLKKKMREREKEELYGKLSQFPILL